MYRVTLLATYSRDQIRTSPGRSGNYLRWCSVLLKNVLFHEPHEFAIDFEFDSLAFSRSRPNAVLRDTHTQAERTETPFSTMPVLAGRVADANLSQHQRATCDI